MSEIPNCMYEVFPTDKINIGDLIKHFSINKISSIGIVVSIFPKVIYDATGKKYILSIYMSDNANATPQEIDDIIVAYMDIIKISNGIEYKKVI